MSDESESGNGSPRRSEKMEERQMRGESTRNSDGSASLDELLDALADQRRRFVLRTVERSETPMALADLADELVREEFGASPASVQDERERIYVSLYHCHLPKLAEAGLVTFDRAEKQVEFEAESGDRATRLLERVADEVDGATDGRESDELATKE